MSEAPLMVGVSGLRGIVGKSLTPEVAARFAGAFGGWLRERAAGRGRPSVVIGRDGRAGGAEVLESAVAGLTAAGCDVFDVGVAMTPTIGCAVDFRGADGGVVVTASHNPQQWNGLKLLVGSGIRRGLKDEPAASAPNSGFADQVIKAFRSGPTAELPGLERGHRIDEKEIAQNSHIIRIVPTMIDWGVMATIRYRRFKVVLDSVNSSGAFLGAALMGEYGVQARVIHLGADGTGLFPHVPEPTRENLVDLCRAVRTHGADIGFAQDPDGDRLAVVDEKGGYIGEEYTLVLAAEALLGSHEDMKAPGRPRPVLVTNLSTSRMIDDVAVRHGAKVIRTAVGEANVVEAMKREKAAGANVALGGEGNGGVIWPRVTYVRDSLSAMALVLALMARTGKTVSELVAGMPRYAIEKRKVDLAKKEDAVPAVEKIAAHWKGHRVDRQDGVRVDFSSGALAGKAWIHVRASNTEPIMRLIAEAPEVGQARAILDEAARVIG